MNLNFFRSLFAVLIVSIISAASVGQGEWAPTAIFGDDNRQEIYSIDPFWKEISNSIAGKVSIEHFKNGGSELAGIPLSKRVCPGTRFAEQLTVPSCTGFLVKPNILVTAGHCMDTPEDCSNFVWVFGYALKNESDKTYTNVSSQQIYKCKQIVSRAFQYLGGLDYAIIELDRPVIDRTPLTLGFDTPVVPGMPLVIIGHPNGLPMKFADGGQVIQLTNNDQSIATDLDVFKGNSGSPIFDAATGAVLGVTSHGHADHIRDPEKLCKINKVCMPGDQCYWSTSSRITNMRDNPIFKN